MQFPSLAEALQASLSGDELSKYVVRNLGFVAASKSDGSVRLRLRPAVVSPTALSALLLLAARPDHRASADLLPRRGMVSTSWCGRATKPCAAAGARKIHHA